MQHSWLNHICNASIPCQVLVLALAASQLIQLPENMPGRTTEKDSGASAPDTHIDPNEVPVPWLQSRAALVTVAILKNESANRMSLYVFFSVTLHLKQIYL